MKNRRFPPLRFPFDFEAEMEKARKEYLAEREEIELKYKAEEKRLRRLGILSILGIIAIACAWYIYFNPNFLNKL